MSDYAGRVVVKGAARPCDSSRTETTAGPLDGCAWHTAKPSTHQQFMLPIFGALLIGLSLGLLGSGGSILTVPVLVYLLGHIDKVAIAESLAIVGAIAFVGMLSYAGSRQVDWRSVVFFGLPGMAGTGGGAWLSHFVPGAAQLVLFAVVMLLAARIMLRSAKRPPDQGQATTLEIPQGMQPPVWQVCLEGFAVGVVTGLVGVGGGFLIVPALVMLGGLPMRTAVGTSLAVIALNSLTGFSNYLRVLASLQLHVDWSTIGMFVAIGIVGSLAGRAVSDRIDQLTLRRVFALFLVVMGLFVLGKEGPRLFAPEKPVADERVISDRCPRPQGEESASSVVFPGTFNVTAPLGISLSLDGSDRKYCEPCVRVCLRTG